MFLKRFKLAVFAKFHSQVVSTFLERGEGSLIQNGSVFNVYETWGKRCMSYVALDTYLKSGGDVASPTLHWKRV